MGLRRKIVKILRKKNLRKEYPSRVVLVGDIARRWWLRVRYFRLRYDTFHTEVDEALGDMLPPHDPSPQKQAKYYIGYDDGRMERVKVTEYGRVFWGGLGGLRRLSRSAVML